MNKSIIWVDGRYGKAAFIAEHFVAVEGEIPAFKSDSMCHIILQAGDSVVHLESKTKAEKVIALVAQALGCTEVFHA